MAKKNAADKVRTEIASDLRAFGNLLNEKMPIFNFEAGNPFIDAAKECENNSHSITQKNLNRKDTWGYSLKKVRLTLDNKKFKDLNPIKAYELRLEYSVDVIGKVGSYGQLCDPLQWLNFNIIITGKDSQAADQKLKCCWHLDRHPEGDEPEFVHPAYHFHFGGHNMTFNDPSFTYGSTLFIPSPRLAHKPLEGILATDFILSNFLPDEWKTMTEPKKGNKQYKNLITKTNFNIWRPYAATTSKNWPALQMNQIAWEPRNIWPQLTVKELNDK